MICHPAWNGITCRRGRSRPHTSAFVAGHDAQLHAERAQRAGARTEGGDEPPDIRQNISFNAS
jgi:hypothetical protein